VEQYQIRWKNYYQILQVSPNAELQAIRLAYRRLALKYHPDATQDNETSAKMVEINEAYSILSNPAKRFDYDIVFKNKYASNKQTYAKPRSGTQYASRRRRTYKQRPSYYSDARTGYGRPRTQSSSTPRESGGGISRKEAKREVLIKASNGLLKVLASGAFIGVMWLLFDNPWFVTFLAILFGISGIVNVFQALYRSFKI
jgi:curved DNA-binding protein CbpA